MKHEKQKQIDHYESKICNFFFSSVSIPIKTAGANGVDLVANSSPSCLHMSRNWPEKKRFLNSVCTTCGTLLLELATAAMTIHTFDFLTLF